MTSIVRYFCIDDESPSVVEPLLDRLRTAQLEIALAQPEEFEKALSLIAKSSSDGLLLDLRLDDIANSSGRRVAYQAMSFAQELRTRMTEGRLNPIPLVLWSVDQKFAKAYNPDSTGKDLFDYVFKKQDVNTKASETRQILLGLVSGYRLIRKCLRHRRSSVFLEILGLKERSASFLDPRIGDRFRSRPRFPVHEYAQFVLRDLIHVNGPLIDESLLAARLGIDPKSSADWSKLKLSLSSAAYTGAFRDAWPRWWALLVEGWWTRLTQGSESLRSLAAKDRVRILRSVTGLKKLSAARALSNSYSERFWTICEVFQTPLDPADALMADGTELKSWQEPRYLSIKSVLERRASQKGFNVHPLDRDRLRAIRSEVAHG